MFGETCGGLFSHPIRPALTHLWGRGMVDAGTAVLRDQRRGWHEANHRTGPSYIHHGEIIRSWINRRREHQYPIARVWRLERGKEGLLKHGLASWKFFYQRRRPPT